MVTFQGIYYLMIDIFLKISHRGMIAIFSTRKKTWDGIKNLKKTGKVYSNHMFNMVGI